MKLDAARLCLDCDEIHDEQICPVCGSEAFAFLTRWIRGSGEHRADQRVAQARSAAAGEQNVLRPARTPEQIEAFRQLIEGPREKPTRALVAKGVAGLAALSLIGWAWRAAARKPASQERGTEPPSAA